MKKNPAFRDFKIVLATGGFDPVHSGHVHFLKESAKLGDILYVGVNSDEWLTRKKGKPFMSFYERCTIINEFECVTASYQFDDSDDSANDLIDTMLNNTKDETTIVFANGGDRTITNIPEYTKYSIHPRVEFAWSVGGEKTNSSSSILKNWKFDGT